MVQPDYANVPPRETRLKARDAALRALELDSGLAEPRAVLAYIKAYSDWDWSGAVEEFRRVIALKPKYATAHHWLAVVLRSMRRFDEALAEIQLAHELDAGSPIITANYGYYLFLDGKPDPALEALKRQVSLDPWLVVAHENLGNIYLEQGKLSEAVAAFETMHRLDESGTYALEALSLAYARASRTNEARKLLGQMEELQHQGLDFRVGIATALHGLGDDDGALKWLEEALAQHANGLDWLNCEPYFKDLRAHPRSQAILRKMNLAREPVKGVRP